MKHLRLALALVLLTHLPALTAEKPAPSQADPLRQWMTEHHLTRVVGYDLSNTWVPTTLYLGQVQPNSQTVQFRLHERSPISKSIVLHGTINCSPEIKKLFTSKVYSLNQLITGAYRPKAIDDAPSHEFIKIENGSTQSLFRNGKERSRFEPIVRQQAERFTQVINAIHEANKKR